MSYTVYKHTAPNGKVYIGITAYNPMRRWGGQGNGYNKQVFHKAIEKYGWDNIKHEILFDNLSKKEALKKEIELISQYNSTKSKYGYNISVGGYATQLGRKLSLEACMKISQAKKGKPAWNKGIPCAEETKNKISRATQGRIPWNKGIPRTKEEKEKMSLNRKGITPWNKGIPCSEQRKKKISEALISKHRGTPIFCVETNTIYYSSLDAERRTGVDNSSILKCCRNRAKTAGKLHWKFVDREVVKC